MSEPHSAPRNSAYLDALSQAIHKKLQKVRFLLVCLSFRCSEVEQTSNLLLLFVCVMNVVQALANSSQRRNLLQELFADIALEVDDRAKGIKTMRYFN